MNDQLPSDIEKRPKVRIAKSKNNTRLNVRLR
jgi:hypothetical protein